MGGEKQDKRQTHRRPRLCVICKRGIKAVGSYSLCRLREGRQDRQQNSTLIENEPMRKHGEEEGGKARQEMNSPSPTSLRDLRAANKSSGLLFSLQSEGGPSTPTAK